MLQTMLVVFVSIARGGEGVLLCNKVLVKPLPAPEATILRSRTPPPHSNLTPQQPQLLPYHSMYTFHKVNVYDILTHTHAHTQSVSSPELHKHSKDPRLIRKRKCTSLCF